MAIQTELEHLTNRDLFSNYYLENLLPESDTWKSIDEDEIEKAFENIKEIYEEHKDYVETYQGGWTDFANELTSEETVRELIRKEYDVRY